ncbi:MAG: NAD-dependent epimerase/dehydratase family protein [Cyclobacteriaceae bacterium]|nr:NAD-dependent epimerase/dehydratase family protein [Cyclobacteriaceae bacterium]
MKNNIHTVLGANGAIGRSVIEELQNRNLPYKSVTRSLVNRGKTDLQVNLLNQVGANKAIAGSAYVYLCIGLPYRTEVWQSQWEIVMQNVIEACSIYNSKLIFLDNMYMYASPLPVPFDENTEQQPVSEKGKARKRTADLMVKAISDRKIKGLIGRSSDFYGEAAVNSPFYISFLERMLRGKNPQTLSRTDIKHTYANVSDNGRALVKLALCKECYGQVWHLPVGEPITANEMIELFNNELGVDYKIGVMPTIFRKFLSVFIKPLKEMEEVRYQFESEYMMSYDKFKKMFPDFIITPYAEGVKNMVEWFKKNEARKSNL